MAFRKCRSSRNPAGSSVHSVCARVWWVCLYLLQRFCVLQPVCPLWHWPLTSMRHFPQITCYFFFFGTAECESPSRTAASGRLRPARLFKKVTSTSFLPRPDAQFELQQVAVTTAPKLNPSSCSHLICLGCFCCFHDNKNCHSHFTWTSIAKPALACDE